MSAHPDDTPPVDGGPDAEEHDGAEPTVDRLRSMWERLDPVPDGVADRIGFALEPDALASPGDDLDELMRLVQQGPGLLSRGDEVRTVTSGSGTTTVVLAPTEVAGGSRVDGWVAPGGERKVEVRTAGGSHDTGTDGSGHVTVALAPPGHLQLVLGADPPARRLATPALTL